MTISKLVALILALCPVALQPNRAVAAESNIYESPALTAKLITAEDGISPDARTVSAGLSLELGEGWKTYWRSPGEVGLPPKIAWNGSANLDAAEFQWPAPTRFRAFGIENFGYEGKVTYPIRLSVNQPGKPLNLKAQISLLVCSNVCVPLIFDLTLALPAEAGIDQQSASKIADWSARVPGDGRASQISVKSAALADEATAVVVELTRETGWSDPDLFPELGDNTAFGTPDIRVSANRRTLWARLPILSLPDLSDPLALTVTDGETAATFESVQLGALPAEPPYSIARPGRGFAAIAWIALLAFGGGVILNAMPCVLPVLSIKLFSALKLADVSRVRIRKGFLVTALGTLAFMWMLAAMVLALQGLGYAIGWGTQFQNPYFLVFLIIVLGLFAANLFGFYEFVLPPALSTRLAGAGRQGYSGDFATGALAAILATPCSAPLLGTAVAFALTGSALEVLLVFTAMGLGLALPYIIVAARPGLVAVLPHPGRWMIVVKIGLGILLAGTAAWLFWVLAGVTSPALATSVAVALAIAILALALGKSTAAALLASPTAVVLIAGALVLPAFFDASDRAVAADHDIDWVTFERAEIARHVSQSHVVFVDVTADWCLTCKANKSLVLNRAPVVDALANADIIPMQADWTRPDPRIQAYLESNGRFGIPLNIVYGPSAPEGIPLSEVLTPSAVIAVIETALGSPIEVSDNSSD